MLRDVRRVCMSAQDSLRAGVCRRLLDGKLAESEAARRLNLSVRKVRRLKVRVREAGDAGVVHRSRGRPSPRKLATGWGCLCNRFLLISSINRLHLSFG
jgi:DNA-binding Lrp family transcriptional regulator